MSKYINLGEEKERQETIKCIILATWTLGIWICLMLYGLAYFSSATVTGQDIYAREIMQKKILRLEELTAGLYYVYSEDKKKRLDYPPPSNAGWVSPARITKGGWAR